MAVTNWNRDPPPGFQGLHPDKPITFYVRHLPHWRQDGASYFVTFRLADSLPQSKLAELDAIRREWERKHPSPRTEKDWDEYTQVVTQQIERALDQGFGECWLRDPELAGKLVGSLRYFDEERYELGCFVVMPNHVHAIMRPLAPAQFPLEKLLQSVKRDSSAGINKALERSGTLWQDESYDRIIRDEEHLYRCIQYIGRNPTNAGLNANEFVLWVRPEWQRLGWGFDGA